MTQKYTVHQFTISNILNWVQSGEIAIPEIQRPFVWDSTKVRDLMDSLYNGFPIGYVTSWKNPTVRLKDGSLSEGKKILIDGQQRITALRAAILGESIIDKDYKEVKIKIAFNPLKEQFETLTPAISKDVAWIPDISELMKKEGGLLKAVNKYIQLNPSIDSDTIEKTIDKLIRIKEKVIGFIELDSSLDIQTVTEIFIRINSKGVVLSQADFAMAKIATYGDFGANLRKAIDYFARLCRDPKFAKTIEENDHHFKTSEYFTKITWLKDENDDLYDPDYTDLLRVSFTTKFERGKLSDLVSLLSGRNFETRSYEHKIMEESFQKLKDGLINAVNEYQYKQFLMIIKSAGFIVPEMISSQNALNMAYIIYLKCREQNIPANTIEHNVRRWFVLSHLTGRYSGSSETAIDEDIRQLVSKGIEKFVRDTEAAVLNENYWSTTLVEELDKTSTGSAYLSTFFASQVYDNNKGFLSSDITVRDMIQQRGDLHHIFPKEYLKQNGRTKFEYNKIANLVWAQTEINIKIGKRSPKEYMSEVYKQFRDGRLRLGGISNQENLLINLEQNAIPETIIDMTADHFDQFLNTRRQLIARKIEQYYQKL